MAALSTIAHSFKVLEDLVVRWDWSLGKRSLLRAEGELTLPSVCDDLFSRSSLL
jgi:hypothetical protein